ncbi:MAG TPA: hypothetical protein VFV23_10375 [Verrucomicrobiae bacterium]|nr:hypothetical protein [Verrucomicrobiae bacterium]
MNAEFFTTIAVTKPVAAGIGVAALVLLYLAFKAVRFFIKIILLLAALAAIGLALWWFLAAHNALH